LGVRVLSGSSSGNSFLRSVVYSILGKTTAVKSYSISSLLNVFWFTLCSAITLWIGNTDLWSSGCYYFRTTGIGIAYLKEKFLSNIWLVYRLIYF
jgi:hypothetical protein